MTRRCNSKTGHVVRALTDGAHCKSGCILVVTGKEACVGHCGVDLEHQPVVGAQPPRVIEVLVNQVARHSQNVSGPKFECRLWGGKLAYIAQEQWLMRYGRN